MAELSKNCFPKSKCHARVINPRKTLHRNARQFLPCEILALGYAIFAQCCEIFAHPCRSASFPYIYIRAFPMPAFPASLGTHLAHSLAQSPLSRSTFTLPMLPMVHTTPPPCACVRDVSMEPPHLKSRKFYNFGGSVGKKRFLRKELARSAYICEVARRKSQ